MELRKIAQKCIALAMGCMLAISAIACAGANGNKEILVEQSESITMTEFDEAVSLLPSSVARYLAADAEELVTSYVLGSAERNDKGKPVTIEYSFDGLEDGKTVKQGLLYRGSEIDGGKNKGHADFCLTSKGIQQLRALGIKTDFDLRSEETKVGEYSILGTDVARTFYNAPQYQSFMSAYAAETVRKIFSNLAKPDAYPIYLHCTHGVDRAGSTALILESLLGVAKENLIRDYELSAFYPSYVHVNRETQNGGNVLELIARLEAFEGETLAEKTAAFLRSVGVTDAEIASIRSIFLGE